MKQNIFSLVVGLVIGMTIMLFGLEKLTNFILEKRLAIVLVGSIVIFFTWLFYINFDKIAIKVFGLTTPAYEQLVETISQLVDNYRNENKEGLKDNVVTLSKQVAVKYGEISTRQWVTSIVFGVFTIFAGLFSIVLLQQQNKIMENQNRFEEIRQLESKVAKHISNLKRGGTTYNATNTFVGIFEEKKKLADLGVDYYLNFNGLELNNQYISDRDDEFDLSGYNLYNGYYSQVELDNINLQYSDFYKSDFFNVTFSNNYLDSIYIDDCSFTECYFYNNNLRGLNWQDDSESVNFNNTIFIGNDMDSTFFQLLKSKDVLMDSVSILSAKESVMKKYSKPDNIPISEQMRVDMYNKALNNYTPNTISKN